jgi:hypothetical protein
VRELIQNRNFLKFRDGRHIIAGNSEGVIGFPNWRGR